MKPIAWLASLAATALLAASAGAIEIPTVPVGNAGNLHDTRYPNNGLPNNGFEGAVDYYYRIGTTEVTNAQYTAFLNSVATLGDPYELYTYSMGVSFFSGISRSGAGTLLNPYSYAVKAATTISSGPHAGTPYPYDNKPVVYVNWGNAVRFANWLHNGQPATGLQDATTTEDGAYTLNGAVTDSELMAVTRNVGVARWWLPNKDEWHKAAYHKNDGPTGNYWDWPTGTNDPNVPVNDFPPGTTNSANYSYASESAAYPMTDVGAYAASPSPYGTFDQGGNVWEWTETRFSSQTRAVRGGSYFYNEFELRASSWLYELPTDGHHDNGFRVATVPEPGTVCLGMLGILGLLLRSRR
jgi:formylglycine-generating enzyme required for sulfatase activity